MIRPEFPEDGVDLGLSHPLADGKEPDHLCEQQAAPAFARRPTDNPAIAPKGAKHSEFVGR